MTTYSLSGNCVDINNVAVPSAVVHLFLTADDSEQAQVTADGSGNWAFTGLSSAGPFYAVAYLDTITDIFGTTVNTLTGTAESGSSGQPMGLLLTLTYP